LNQQYPNFVPREWVVIWRRKERERKREIKYLQRSLAVKNAKKKMLEKRIEELENQVNKIKNGVNI
jgi:hypothetical protein